MFCGAVGAGNSLLLLLGDSAESKGKVSVPRLLFLATRSVSGSVRRFSSRTKRRWSGVIWRCCAPFPLGFCGCTDAVRDMIKGLLVSVGRH